MICLFLLWSGPVMSAEKEVQAVIVKMDGVVEILRAGAETWHEAKVNLPLYVGDSGRVGTNSHATLRMQNGTIAEVAPEGKFLVQPPPEKDRSAFSFFLEGVAYFFHLGKPTSSEVHSPVAVAATRGTEFGVEVDAEGGMSIAMLDGEVELSNDVDSIILRRGEEGRAVRGQRPTRTVIVDAVNVVQWFLYYPGILHIEDLAWNEGNAPAWQDSLAAYRQGDLLQALHTSPPEFIAETPAERIYRATLLMSVGEVHQVESILKEVQRETLPSHLDECVEALRLVIAAVQLRDRPRPTFTPQTATGWLAESYYQQSRAALAHAREAARQAVAFADNFGFGWARLAELEVGFGHTQAARDALDKALRHSPRNAQAHAARGFLLMRERQFHEAWAAFDQAIELDGNLANGWLGRGLTRLHMGDAEGGEEDLTLAAALEPQRSVLRSYLAKVLYASGDEDEAFVQIDLAKQWDPADPTPWLYAALMNQTSHRLNEAMRDLQRSKSLNPNRAIYRSQQLLDQDQAVRSANLAGIYAEVGMEEVAQREAGRAVVADYANYAAHLFLSDSYQQLLDPRRISVRYESAWLSEFLVANLLAPVGVGTLTTARAHQEYRRLFDRRSVGATLWGEYQSQGTWAQQSSIFGSAESMAFSVDTAYRDDSFSRPEGEVETLSYSTQFKQQVTAQDSLLFQIGYAQADSSGSTPFANQPGQNSGTLTSPFLVTNQYLRIRETEEPTVLMGYHRHWAPGSDSLVMAGFVDTNLELESNQQETFFLSRSSSNFDNILEVIPTRLRQIYRNDIRLYTLEGQHLWRRGDHQVIVGGRYQVGNLTTYNEQNQPTFTITNFGLPANISQRITSELDRGSVYLYEQWEALDDFFLCGGLSYDHVKYPANFRYAPLQDEQASKSQWSPKAGVLWLPGEQTSLRAAYGHNLGGVSLERNFQLEPTQVAGVNQLYRSLIPNAIRGAQSVPEQEILGVILEHRLPTETYLGLGFDWWQEEASRHFGVLNYSAITTPLTTAGSVQERIDYEETSLQMNIHQLIGQSLALGMQYRVSQAEFEYEFPAAITSRPGGENLDQDLEGILHRANLTLHYSHPSGWFGLAEAIWSQQNNRSDGVQYPDADFWQFNLAAGYRFPRNHAELRLSLLNLTDRGYQLNPLNVTTALPQERTLALTVTMNF